MKITFNIECTPQEARSFFGMPDVAPMQDRMLKQMEAQFRKNMGAMDVENLFKGFLTGSNSSIEKWQEMFGNMLKSGGNTT